MNSMISPKKDLLIPLTIATILLNILVLLLLILIALELYDMSMKIEEWFENRQKKV